MFNGITKRILSLWFPRLASDRVLRIRPVEAPFALILNQNNSNWLYCLNKAAEAQGLSRGMPCSDARAYCPDLITRPADLHADQRFLLALRRWATRYCPWVGLEGHDGLVLDITGSAHLMGGEKELVEDLKHRLTRAGLTAEIGLADTRGAAWGMARHGGGIAKPGAIWEALGPLPVEALRLETDVTAALQRLGLRSIAELAKLPRAPLTRRFGPMPVMRLDQALGNQPEEISPMAPPPHYGVRMTLPEPIGLTADVMAGASRLMDKLCAKLDAREVGARILCLTLRRVDQESQQVELRLARALRDPDRILPLFERGVSEVDAGYGIDQMRLEAVRVEPMPLQQTSYFSSGGNHDRLNDLITRIGTRIGLENVRRFLSADSHIPERSFSIAPAAHSKAEHGWTSLRPRPLLLFPPEPISGSGPNPPRSFRWRRMMLTLGRATGPERIAPEWWLVDNAWRSGVRDYWQVATRQGRRLWLYYTPQNPGWFVQGEFA